MVSISAGTRSRSPTSGASSTSSSREDEVPNPRLHGRRGFGAFSPIHPHLTASVIYVILNRSYMRSTAYQEEYLSAYDAYADAVFRLCYGKTSNREEAKDMTQEVFLRVWQRLESGAGDIENVRAFLF